MVAACHDVGFFIVRIARKRTQELLNLQMSNKETGAVKNYHWEIYINQ